MEMLNIRNKVDLRGATKSLFDAGYRKDREIAAQAGINLQPEQYEALKREGSTLGTTFSEGVIISEYTDTGIYSRTEGPNEIQDRINKDVREHLEAHFGALDSV